MNFKKTLLAAAAAASIAVLSSGCVATSTEVQTFSGVVPAGITAEQFNSSLMDAGLNRDWVIKKLDSNTYRAVYTARSHSITCELVLGADGTYTISYVSSIGMDYDAADGTIHRNYNRWVNNLKHDLDTRLMQKSVMQ